MHRNLFFSNILEENRASIEVENYRENRSLIIILGILQLKLKGDFSFGYFSSLSNSS